MKHFLRITCILAAALLLFAGCSTDTSTPPTGSPSATAPIQNTPDTRPTVTSDTSAFVQRAYDTDYSYVWWPEGFYGNLPEVYAMTGSYGLALNAATGYISRFGAFRTQMNKTDAMNADNSIISTLPSFAVKYGISYGGKDYPMNYVQSAEENGNSTRILESGRFLQRLDLLYLRAKDNDDLYGRMEVTVLPDCFAMNFEVFPDGRRIDNAVLSMSLSVNKDYSAAVSQDGRSAVVCDSTGYGYTVVIPTGIDAAIAQDGDFLAIRANVRKLARSHFTGFGIIIIPSVKASFDDAAQFLARDSVTVEAQQLSPNEKAQTVTYDYAHGMYSVGVNGAFSLTEGQMTEKDLDTYEKVRFTLTNNSDRTVRVPVQFVKEDPLSVTGPSPMLLDPESGEPTGHTVQITRNWHGYDSTVPENSPKRCWEGRWYHCYTVIEVPAHQSVSYDFCVSYARWGGIESVVHSQLCLAGWGGNLQQWETCSLGAYGESFCYDVARTLTHCTMGDICAFGLYSRIDGRKYNWTTNIGGADFLGVIDLAGNPYRVSSMKSYFKNHGPNLSEVIYTGTIGGKIRFTASARTPRTDDISTAYQTFSYTFLEDVKYSRLWFYQFGADSYNYDYWKRMVAGNNDGPISFEMNGVSLSGEFAVPKVDIYPDYLSHGGMNPVEVPGEGAWFAFLGADSGQSKGNKAISVKEYSAVINGKAYTQPSFSVRTTGVYVTEDIFWEGAGFELNPPAEANGLIKAGSTVSFTVQYYNLPAHKSDYYGKGEALASLPEGDWDTWKLPYMYATRSNIGITAQTGTVESIYTPLIRSNGAASGVAAEFTVYNGIGYVPVTISGVKGYSGWRLEQKTENGWKELDQEVHGNDYWQAWYDESDGTFELTFNVPTSGADSVGQYRLIKE